MNNLSNEIFKKIIIKLNRNNCARWNGEVLFEYSRIRRWLERSGESDFALTGLSIVGFIAPDISRSRWLNSWFLLPFSRRTRSSDYWHTKVKVSLRETRSRLGYRLQGCRQPSSTEDDMSGQTRRIVPVIRR